jgi:hypothetical protein
VLGAIWGGSTNFALASSSWEVSCESVGGGSVQNPEGGGAGVGEIAALEFYECKAPQCEALVKERFGVQGRGVAIAQNLPWSDEVFEGGVPNGGREKLGEPFAPSSEPRAGEIKVTTSCEVAPTQKPVTTSTYEGELEPEAGGELNGMSAAKPSSIRFAGSSGGAVHSETGEAAATGSFKYLGYTTQEVIAVR